jgi:hypothetical protein
MKKNLPLIVISVVSAIIVTIAVGFNFFLIWNLLPAVACYFLTKKYFNNWYVLKIFSKICLIFLLLFLIVFPVFASFMWIFDIAGTKTGSSMAGLIFIFIPFWAFVFSLLPYIIIRTLGITHNEYQSTHNNVS